MCGFTIGMFLSQMTDTEFLECLLKMGKDHPEHNPLDTYDWHYRSRMRTLIENLVKDGGGTRNGYGLTPAEQVQHHEVLVQEALAHGLTREELGLSNG